MGRPQKEIRSFTTPAGELALGLRELRRRARTTYREMAEKTGYAPSTFSKAASGERMPTREVCSAFVECCNGDVTEWIDRWSKAQARDTLGAQATPGEPPRRARHARHTQVRRKDPAPHPRHAATAAQFVTQLSLLKIWTDLTLAQIVARSIPADPQSATGRRVAAPTLSKSTISEALRSTKLPRLQFVERFVRACGGTDAEVQAWADTWKILRCREIANAGGNPGDAVEQVAKVVASQPRLVLAEAVEPRDIASRRTAREEDLRAITTEEARREHNQPNARTDAAPDGSLAAVSRTSSTTDASLGFVAAVMDMRSSARTLDSALIGAHDLAYEISARLDRALARRLNARLAETLVHDLERAVDEAYLLELEIDRAHSCVATPDRILAALQARDLHLTSGVARAHAAASNLARDLERGLPLDQARTRALDLARDLARLRAHVNSIVWALNAIPLDASGIDLSPLKPTDLGLLAGMVWDDRTVWPRTLIEYVHAESEPLGVGVFKVRGSRSERYERGLTIGTGGVDLLLGSLTPPLADGSWTLPDL